MAKVNYFEQDPEYDSRSHSDGGRHFRRWLDNAITYHRRSDRIRTYPVWLSAVEAEVILERNKINRNPTLGGIIKISNEMENDTFVDCADPIVFDKQGIMASGQNRMGALLSSDKHFPFSMAFGQEREHVAIAIDGGAKRTGQNVLTERGEEIPLALLRSFYFPPLSNWRAMSAAETLALTELVRGQAEELLEIVNYCESRNFLRQRMPVLGAVLRAMYWLPNDKVFRFLEVYAAGPQADIKEDCERNALVLRDLLTRTKCTNNYDRSFSFMRTAHSLNSYAKGKALTVIKLAKTASRWVSPFKLPAEVIQLKTTWDNGILKARPEAAATARAIKARLEEHRKKGLVNGE